MKNTLILSKNIYKESFLIHQATSAAELGDLKATQLAYAEAAFYYQEAAELVPADEKEDLAGYLNEEGLAWLEAGKYGSAEAPLERALAIREKTLGPEHPDVATSLDNLAKLYRAQLRFEEAVPLSLRASAIRNKALEEETLGIGAVEFKEDSADVKMRRPDGFSSEEIIFDD